MTFKEELNKLRFLGTRKRTLKKVYEKNIKYMKSWCKEEGNKLPPKHTVRQDTA